MGNGETTSRTTNLLPRVAFVWHCWIIYAHCFMFGSSFILYFLLCTHTTVNTHMHHLYISRGSYIWILGCFERGQILSPFHLVQLVVCRPIVVGSRTIWQWFSMTWKSSCLSPPRATFIELQTTYLKQNTYKNLNSKIQLFLAKFKRKPFHYTFVTVSSKPAITAWKLRGSVTVHGTTQHPRGRSSTCCCWFVGYSPSSPGRYLYV